MNSGYADLMSAIRCALVLVAFSLSVSAPAFAGKSNSPAHVPTCVCRTPELGEELLYPIAPIPRAPARTPELGEELLQRTPELGEELLRRTPELGDELLVVE